MNINKNILGTCMILVLSLAIISCKKDINGCTDANADNYNDKANVDDGSCSFHAHLNPWYDTETRDSLLANNVASVSVYIEGEVFTNILPASVLWSSAPECSTSAIGNWISMQGVKSKSISLLVRALDGSNVVVREWNESMTVESGTCYLYKITW